MKKIYLTMLSFCFCSICMGQFYSSENVYCYEYEYTLNDGIKSKGGTPLYFFVNFQNDMMGFTSENTKARVKQRLLENPSYYDDMARNDLAKDYSRWKSLPNGYYLESTYIIHYNEQYSTTSKYTYRLLKKTAQSAYYPATWGEPYWEIQCYTFSIDRSEMIVWGTNDPENRKYYKLIDASDLIPNTDFLY